MSLVPSLRDPITESQSILEEPPGMEFGEGDATKQKSMKKSAFSLNEGKVFNE